MVNLSYEENFIDKQLKIIFSDLKIVQFRQRKFAAEMNLSAISHSFEKNHYSQRVYFLIK